jgi:hypothetical protein
MPSEFEILERIEKAVAPMRERMVLAEAVCEALLEDIDVFTNEKVKAAIEEWARRVPR